jgi:hypothetical protein
VITIAQRDAASAAFHDHFRRMAVAASPRISTFSGLHTGKPNGMAAGLEGLLAFAALVEDPNAMVLDLGVGASSAVLRTLFPNVLSADSDEEYLKLVQRVCGEAGINNGNFFVGLHNVPPGDYVFYDYGNDRVRTDHLELVWSKTRCLLWIDDADDREVSRAFVERLCVFFAARGLRLEYRLEGKDGFGRSGSIVRVPRPVKTPPPSPERHPPALPLLPTRGRFKAM